MVDNSISSNAMQAEASDSESQLDQGIDCDPRTIASFSIARAYWLFKSDMRSRLKDIGISGHAVNALWVIVNRNGVTQQELVKEIEINEGTLVATIDELISVGAVTKSLSPTDRRVNIIYPTEQGRKILTQGLGILRQHENHMLTALNAAERESLESYLNRIVSFLQKRPDSDS